MSMYFEEFKKHINTLSDIDRYLLYLDMSKTNGFLKLKHNIKLCS